ncbi:MAG: DCC1-like thiol-disulfide oxidoreductase family protein [bacterium]
MVNLVLYDGQCGLCNSTVLWLLKIDRRRVLTFAPLQGETAKLFSLPAPSAETIVFVSDFRTSNQRIALRSDAVLQILRTVGGMWKFAAIVTILPRGIRDAVYNWIARNRYRWFSRLDTCKLPPPEVKYRFLA